MKRNKGFVNCIKTIGIVIAFSCLLSGCQKGNDLKKFSASGSGNETETEESNGLTEEGLVKEPELVKHSDNDVAVIEMAKKTVEKNDKTYEYATVTAYDNNSDPVWVRTSDYFEAEDVSNFSDVFDLPEGFLYTEGNSVLCLERSTGKVLWKNNDLNARGLSSCLDNSNNIWLCGYEGDELLVIDTKGTTINRIQKFVENDEFYWPRIVEIKDDLVIIEYQSISKSKPGEGKIEVEMETYDYSFQY